MIPFQVIDGQETLIDIVPDDLTVMRRIFLAGFFIATARDIAVDLHWSGKPFLDDTPPEDVLGILGRFELLGGKQ